MLYFMGLLSYNRVIGENKRDQASKYPHLIFPSFLLYCMQAEKGL